MLLNGERIPFLGALPANAAQASPLLARASGDQLFRRGRLNEAKKMLAWAVKGFARQANAKELCTSIALQAIVALHCGDMQEAETALLFLQNDYDGVRQKDDLDGLVPLALGIGSHLIESGTCEGAYFLTAADLFIKNGDPERAACSLIEMAAFGHSPSAGELSGRQPCLASMLRENPRYASYLDLVNDEHIYCAALAGIADLRLRMKGNGEIFPDELHELNKLIGLQSGDAVLQFHAALFRHEYFGRNGDFAEAHEALTKARAIAGRCRFPFALRTVRQLERQNKARKRIREQPHDAPEVKYRVKCFGGLSFFAGDKDAGVIHWKRKKAQELFLYLLFRAQYAAPREQIIDVLFGEGDPLKTSNRLYVIIHDLKRILRDSLGVDDGVLIRDGIIRLREESIDSVDVEKYTTLVRVADQLWLAERELAIEMYEQARLMYDQVVPEIQYVDWLDLFRESLVDMQENMLKKLARHAAAVRDDERTEAALRDWVALRPLQEEAYQEWMRFLRQKGRHAEAKTWYKKLETVVRDELGFLPSEESRRIGLG